MKKSETGWGNQMMHEAQSFSWEDAGEALMELYSNLV